MKRVLIITYYWPPSGGGGVYRWLKFAKYLPQYGWEPVICTPLNPDFPIRDFSLLEDVDPHIQVIKRPIWEPYRLFKLLTGRKKNENVNVGLFFDERKPGLILRVSLWIRGNLFIPDPRRFWVNPASRYLIRHFHEIKPDVVVTTGPPHSMHLIGLNLKRKFHMPWIADFRDHWSQIDVLEKFFISETALKRQMKLERKVLVNSDRILAVSTHWGMTLGELGAKDVTVITNGYDQDEFTDMEASPAPDRFVISHFGILNSYRNHSFVWKTIEELCQENKAFSDNLEINLVGVVDQVVVNELEALPVLSKRYRIRKYIPHKEIKEEYKRSSVLLLFIHRSKIAMGNIPGKFFEYLASLRPILCIGPPEGDCAVILRETRTGEAVAFDDSEQLKDVLRNLFQRRNNQGDLSDRKKQIIRYSRQSISEELAGVLDELVQPVKNADGKEKHTVIH